MVESEMCWVEAEFQIYLTVYIQHTVKLQHSLCLTENVGESKGFNVCCFHLTNTTVETDDEEPSFPMQTLSDLVSFRVK